MFDSTFFKFLIAFIVIIALSFVVMGFVGDTNTVPNAQNTSSSQP